MTIARLLGTVALGLFANMAGGMAHAQDKGECEVHYTRTACPGKEAESFAKCEGKASCNKRVETAATPQACQTVALKACANDRLDVTKSKVITAVFKGQALKSATGKADFCMDYEKRAAEFDKCGK
ncbi:MAG: hypothetical protein JF606_10775 [Burkholderiales bacterium]|nr:hypothetical protein [Burkholderiales bacterium]